MKKLSIGLLFLVVFITGSNAQQFVNGNFMQSVIADPGSFMSPLNCPSFTTGWRMGSVNGLDNPQITDFNQTGNTYIDLTPCGTKGNGSWIEQDIEFSKQCRYSISFDVKPMNGQGEAAFWLFMNGNKIGPSCITSSDQTRWVRKTTVAFAVSPGKHTFRIGTGCSSNSNQFEVVGIDNFSLNKVGDCQAETDGCTCNNFKSVVFTAFNNPSNNKSVACGNTFVIKAGSFWNMKPNYKCYDPQRLNLNCETSFTYYITRENGSSVIKYTETPYPFQFTDIGNYTITVEPTCGGKTCKTCTIKVFVTPGCDGDVIR